MDNAKANKFSTLDLLRALSALLVAWGHSRFVMLKLSAEVPDLNYVNKLIYFIAGFGPQAVLVFFVLSGFFITRSIFNSFEKETFSFKSYFIARFFRLSVVAIPAVFLTLVLDNLSFNLFSSYYLYKQNLGWIDSTSYSFFTFIGNIAYLQTLIANSFGSNGPLWSLAYEWWFYVLAPFAFTFFYSKKNITLIVFLLLYFTIFYFNSKIAFYFIYWLFGGLAYYLSIKNVKINKLSLHFIISLVLVFCFATLIRLRFVSPTFGDGFLSLSVAYLVFILVKLNINIESRYLSFFTNISYSLYAVHFPIMMFIFSCFATKKMNPTFGNTILNIVFFGIVIIFSYCFWYVFERNTEKIKRYFIK